MKKPRFTDSRIMAIPAILRLQHIKQAEAARQCRSYVLEAESGQLKKMYAEKRLKAEIVAEALKKRGEAVSPP